MSALGLPKGWNMDGLFELEMAIEFDNSSSVSIDLGLILMSHIIFHLINVVSDSSHQSQDKYFIIVNHQSNAFGFFTHRNLVNHLIVTRTN